ncbi:hypothetical protein [Candidatus Palauibacter sp.]|uniref:hypothetical protein n=1 Tax=Candidatus Palauibacter sp. TaxID=3101350 RepID=UPI003B02CCD9
MKEFNITLSEDVARWLWIKAAEDNKTVSEWVTALLEEARRRHHDYRIAMQMMLTATPGRIDWPSERGYRRAESSDYRGKKRA